MGIEEERETLEVIYLKDGQRHCLACEGGQVEGGVYQPQVMRAMQLNFASKEHKCLKAFEVWNVRTTSIQGKRASIYMWWNFLAYYKYSMLGGVDMIDWTLLSLQRHLIKLDRLGPLAKKMVFKT